MTDKVYRVTLINMNDVKLGYLGVTGMVGLTEEAVWFSDRGTAEGNAGVLNYVDKTLGGGMGRKWMVERLI